MCVAEESLSVWSASENLSPRVERLRDEYFNYDNRNYFRNETIPYTTGTEWDSVYTPHERTIVPEFVPVLESVQDSLLAFARKIPLPEGFWDQPLIVRHALFFEEVLKRHPVHILDGELIVGGHFSTSLSNCLNEAESRLWRKQEEEFFGRVKYLIEHGVLNCGATQGHIIPNHPRLLKEGFSGIQKRAEAMLAVTMGDKKRDLLGAVIHCCEGVRLFAERYSRKAAELAERETDEARRSELLKISEICLRVPYYPAETFHEALQAVWFQHMLIIMAESYPGPGVSHGRFDQYMFPYYEKDLHEGRITREEAKELLRCFWIKHNYAYDFFGTSGGRQGITSGDGQLITLAGQGLQGEDLTNEMSYMVLEVCEEMNMLEPKINVRLHRKTPQEFLDFITGIMSRTQGSPFLLNFDSIVIRALENQGLTHEDAVDYGVVGCLENTAQGKDRSGTVDVNVNLAKAMELALNQGRDAQTGEPIGAQTPDPRSFTTYETFKEAVFDQIRHILKTAVELYGLCDGLRATYEPVPYLSAIVDGCLEKGMDINAGGAIYNFVTVEGVGLATLADSVTAVKKLVFDEKRISIGELLDALRKDFRGNEKLRRILINHAPKFGNDDEYADEVAREVSRFWSEEISRYVSPLTGRRFRPGYLSWNYFISFAPKTAATPDGRRRGDTLSNGACPAQGADRKGPTAAFKSVTHLGFDVVPNGASYTPSFSPASIRDEEHRAKFIALLRAYEALGGTAMQVNVIDADTLRAAQRNPAQYENLLVRVTGYNAYFTQIGKALQDEIIARTIFEIR